MLCPQRVAGRWPRPSGKISVGPPPQARAAHRVYPSPATRQDFTLFTRATGERFAPAEREALHKATFEARRQLPDESFAILADDLHRPVALVFSNAPHDVSMELARDQFVDAVSSTRLQQRLKEDPPASLDAAVRRAVQLEAVWGTAAATPVPSSVPQGADVFAVHDRAPDAHLDLVAAMGNLGCLLPASLK